MFEDWWKLYPRKVGKLDAAKAYAAAIKKGATHDELALGIRAFCQLLLERGTDRTFVPHPATWLRAGRWADEELRQISGNGVATLPQRHNDEGIEGAGASIRDAIGADLFRAYFGDCGFSGSLVLAPSQARKDYILNKFQHRIEGLKVEVKP